MNWVARKDSALRLRRSFLDISFYRTRSPGDEEIACAIIVAPDFISLDVCWSRGPRFVIVAS